MKNKIWFIIVIYRPDYPLLRRNLATLAGYPTVIVDNRDDRHYNLATFKKFKNLTLLDQKANLGYGGGNNLGSAYALKQGAEWVVILNDDLVLEREAIKQFISDLSQTPPGLVGPYRGTLDPKRWTTVFVDQQNQPPNIVLTYLSGSFLAVHREVIGKLGRLFYEPYFLFYEDAELSMRVKRHGFSLRYQPLDRLEHRASSSTGKGSPLQQYYLARNHLLFVERNAPPGVRVRELIRLPKTIYEHRQKREKWALRGIRDYCLRRFGRQKLII